jgi:hypothetical protein
LHLNDNALDQRDQNAYYYIYLKFTFHLSCLEIL